nr:probable polygalacturonase At3g15720 [Tanacetum cinerariifolium]
MGFIIVVFLTFFYASSGSKTTSEEATFDVTHYGAIGDGNADDTDAFVQAWADVCACESEEPTLFVPPDLTFLLRCVSFSGPCRLPNIYIQLLGDITAPKSLDGWEGCDTNGYLIKFDSIDGLTIEGGGQLDGQGSIWWPGSEVQPTGADCKCPSMLQFHKCDGLQLIGTRHINGPKRHISIYGCRDVEVHDLHISAPEYSPNTDGIDVGLSSHVYIHDSTIETGDDCVAIGSGVYDINVTGVFCGPGHGISIGSLGKNGHTSTVEKVIVRDCTLSGTQNGLRIKTVPGYAKKITFRDITLENVKNPIIIDQHYCTSTLNHYCPAPPGASAVQVSGITYKNIYGTSASKKAISFDCSEDYKCHGIVTKKVDITGEDVTAYCKNVYGKFYDTNPSINCH